MVVIFNLSSPNEYCRGSAVCCSAGGRLKTYVDVLLQVEYSEAVQWSKAVRFLFLNPAVWVYDHGPLAGQFKMV